MHPSLLIIDFANTLMRSIHVHPQLEFNGIPTGGLFGVINQFANQINKYHPTHILVCKDSPPYLRKKQYPEYKQNRKKLDSNDDFSRIVKTSFQLAEEFCGNIDVPIWGIPGLEADDLIAQALLKYSDHYKKIYVLSNDDDLNQFLDLQNLILLRKNKEYNWENFNQDYPSITPKDWVMLTAMTGTHNAVKGIDRIGIKTALKIMNDVVKLESTYQQHKELLELNYSLIQLPYPKFNWKTVEIPELNTPKMSEMKLMRYIEQYGIRYSTIMMEAFSKYSIRNKLYV